jgi:dihydroflavonol-4-reductase
MAPGRINQRYILGGQNAFLRDMLAAVASLPGRKPPIVKVSRASLYPLTYAAERVARITGKEPLLTMDAP